MPDMDILDPDDKRALFQRIVDDIRSQILDGELRLDVPLPSARELAQRYGVASMTAQRALRELKHLRLSYGIPGKGTYVHPDALDIPRGRLMREPVNQDPDLRRRVADYLTEQKALFARYDTATTARQRNKAINQVIAHAADHEDLIDEMARYQTSHGNPAQPLAKEPYRPISSPEDIPRGIWLLRPDQDDEQPDVGDRPQRAATRRTASKPRETTTRRSRRQT